MQNINSRAGFIASVASLGTGATVQSVRFAKSPQERELLSRLKKSAITPSNRVIKSSKIR